MKKYMLFLIAIPMLLVQACEKKDTNKLQNFNAPYQLNNVHDYYVNAGETKDFDVKLSLSNPLHDGTRFTITPEGVPAGVTVYPTSVNVSYLDSFSCK